MTTNIQARDVEAKEVWNDYWASKKTKGGLLYDVIAEIYRRVLIRPSLGHFLRKHFKQGSEILHAGSGSGQVDTDIRSYLNITALDISPNALEVYKRENGASAKTILGSIFQIPLPDASMDGIYNLGVMEHFTEAEIVLILKDFGRVVRPGGKLVLFWPPEFGLSVLFFKALKIFFAVVLRKPDVKFHPDEICRLRSKKHGAELLAQAGFKIVDYSFGPRDFFTYSVVVASRS
jgi:SAM-dependent methyltransferase